MLKHAVCLISIFEWYLVENSKLLIIGTNETSWYRSVVNRCDNSNLICIPIGLNIRHDIYVTGECKNAGIAWPDRRIKGDVDTSELSKATAARCDDWCWAVLKHEVDGTCTVSVMDTHSAGSHQPCDWLRTLSWSVRLSIHPTNELLSPQSTR